MKLHVQCDRCKKYAETLDDGTFYKPAPPATWHQLRAFAWPLRLNEGVPEGPIAFLLCGDCLPTVQRVIEEVVGKRR